MRYLLLGSSGQIGRALTEHLRRRNQEVIEFDIKSSQEQDLRKRSDLLREAMSGADFVFFLAFDVGGSRYLDRYQHSYEFISNNVKIMDCTFDMIKDLKKDFIFASSQMSNMLYSSYGILKAVGEVYTRSLGGVIVKFWNVYGYEDDPEKSHVITDFILKAKDTGIIHMLTDGSELRQFLYSDDCAECLFILSQRYKEIPRNQELHITSFEWTSIFQLAQLIAGSLGAVQVIPAKKMDQIQQGQINEPDPFVLKYWKPNTSLEDGIRKLISAYLQRP